MGIYIGEKLLRPKKTGNTLEKRYYEEREELKDFFEKFKIEGGPVPFIVLSREYAKRWNRKKTTWKPAPPMSLPMTTSIYDEEVGSISVRYSSNAPQKVDNRIIWQRNKETDLFFDTMSISIKQLDLAWFLLRATNYLEKNMFKIVDTRAEFSSKFNEAVVQKDVSSMIFADYVTEEMLAKVAHDFMEMSEIDYNAISGKEELAIKLWSKAVIEDKKTKKNSFVKLLKICRKYKLDVKPVKELKKPQVILVKDKDDKEIEIPLLDTPVGINRASLFEEASKFGINNAKKLKNGVIYTLIEHQKSLAKMK